MLKMKMCTAAFAPSLLHRLRCTKPLPKRTAGLFTKNALTVRALAEDPSGTASSALDFAQHHFNVVASLAEDAAAQVSAATAVTGIDSSTISSASETASSSGGGPFDGVAQLFESILQALDALLEKAHVPYSYGFAIILLTILVKVAAFPLTQKQVQSTVAIQALQPKIKELQAKYANDTQTLQLETGRLYQATGVNPLAGCLPTLATIPVFIGLYRALTLAAQDNLLNDSFFWIPSLGGPASLAEQKAGTGLQWLFPFVDGQPPIGWHDAAAYLVMPVMLIVSQSLSQRILSPQSNDPQVQQSQAILKVLPFMVGWFSLNVPAGLTLYWFTNNILTTAQQVYLKSTTKVNIPEDLLNSVGSGTPSVTPKEEKVKKGIAGKDLSARKNGSLEPGPTDQVQAAALSASPAADADGAGPRKGSKFRARQAREAAAKAAQTAAGTTNSTTPQ